MEAGEAPATAPGRQRKGDYVMDDLVFCVLRDGLTPVEPASNRITQREAR